MSSGNLMHLSREGDAMVCCCASALQLGSEANLGFQDWKLPGALFLEEVLGGVGCSPLSVWNVSGLQWELVQGGRMRCCGSLCWGASGPGVSSCNFGFGEYSDFTISWLFLPFIYSCLLFTLVEVQAVAELRLKKKVQANTCSFFFFPEIFSQL